MAKTTVLEFSGGRDSTCTLYLLRPILDEIIVVHANPGSTYPHVQEHVRRTCEKLGAELVFVRPPTKVEDWTEEVGYPTDILPVWADVANKHFVRDPSPQQLISPIRCCTRNLWIPMHDFVERNGIKLVLRGVREVDHHQGVGPGTVVNGVTYDAPIWDWTDDDIERYIAAENIDLPGQYDAHKGADSFDCWCCTAHAGHGTMGARLKYTRAFYPELFDKVKARHEAVARVVDRELEAVRRDISEGLGDGD